MKRDNFSVLQSNIFKNANGQYPFTYMHKNNLKELVQDYRQANTLNPISIPIRHEKQDNSLSCIFSFEDLKSLECPICGGFESIESSFYFDPLLHEMFTRKPNMNVIYFKDKQVLYTDQCSDLVKLRTRQQPSSILNQFQSALLIKLKNAAIEVKNPFEYVSVIDPQFYQSLIQIFNNDSLKKLQTSKNDYNVASIVAGIIDQELCLSFMALKINLRFQVYSKGIKISQQIAMKHPQIITFMEGFLISNIEHDNVVLYEANIRDQKFEQPNDRRLPNFYVTKIMTIPITCQTYFLFNMEANEFCLFSDKRFSKYRIENGKYEQVKDRELQIREVVPHASLDYSNKFITLHSDKLYIFSSDFGLISSFPTNIPNDVLIPIPNGVMLINSLEASLIQHQIKATVFMQNHIWNSDPTKFIEVNRHELSSSFQLDFIPSNTLKKNDTIFRLVKLNLRDSNVSFQGLMTFDGINTLHIDLI